MWQGRLLRFAAGEKRQRAAEVVRIETRPAEQVEIVGGAVPEVQCHRGAAVQNESGRHHGEFIP